LIALASYLACDARSKMGLSMSYGLADDELMALLREMLDRDRRLVRDIPEPSASPLSVDEIEEAEPE